ncbi:MAG: type I methionyl aminopeptidase [bacterium]|nr:type I methionyl aminopeptidase [bacterium]
MLEIKTQREIDILKRLCVELENILFDTGSRIAEFKTTYDIQTYILNKFKSRGIKSAFYKYNGYPEYICVSINDEVVHGIPKKNKFINENDLVKIDIGGIMDGLIADIAYSFGGLKYQKLINAAVEALNAAVKNAVPGNYVGNISKSIEAVAKKYNLGIIKSFVGHGIGRNLHEDPQIPNYYINDGIKLEKNMVLCIEPMFCLGSGETTIDLDGWTARTSDRSIAVHIEGMVVVDVEPIILTPRIFGLYGKSSC